jgi:uncharacterized protein (UPF0218 family)
MLIKRYLTPELRIKLKQPLGILIKGSFVDTMRRLKDMAEREKPPAIIAVGDTVSRNIAESGFTPLLSIVDNKCMRKSTKPARLIADQTVYVKNPQGTITEEAETAIENALKGSQHIKMVVVGEEDLLTLAATAYAPENSFVIYGQPYEGIVVVKATPEKKAEISKILKSMENVKKVNKTV